MLPSSRLAFAELARYISAAALILLRIAAALIAAAMLIHFSGHDWARALSSLWSGATGIGPGYSSVPYQLGPISFPFDKLLLAQSLSRVTPVLLCGVSASIALRAGIFNIGVPGQLVVGAFAAAIAGTLRLSYPLSIAVVLACGALAGAAWGYLAVLAKVRRGVHEVISTILLNYIAVNLCDYFVAHGLRDLSSMSLQTREVSAAAQLGTYVPGSDFTVSFVVSLFLAFAFWLFMDTTIWGFETKVVGSAPEAAEAAGIPPARVQGRAMFLSGAVAGLCGAFEIMSVHHRYVNGIAGNYGFDGIAVALLGGTSPLGVLSGSFFFGMLGSGASYLQIQTDIPSPVSMFIQGIVICVFAVRFRVGRETVAKFFVRFSRMAALR